MLQCVENVPPLAIGVKIMILITYKWGLLPAPPVKIFTSSHFATLQQCKFYSKLYSLMSTLGLRMNTFILFGQNPVQACRGCRGEIKMN